MAFNASTADLKNFRAVADRNSKTISVPTGFWEFWRLYQNSKEQQSIALNFADFPHYYRLLLQISKLATKESKSE